MYIQPQPLALGIAISLTASAVAVAQPFHLPEAFVAETDDHTIETMHRSRAFGTPQADTSEIEPNHTNLHRRDDEGVNSGNSGGGGSARLNFGKCTIL